MFKKSTQSGLFYLEFKKLEFGGVKCLTRAFHSYAFA